MRVRIDLLECLDEGGKVGISGKDGDHRPVFEQRLDLTKVDRGSRSC